MVLLKKDGQIVFEGDRYYAQNKLDGLQNVSHVTALPNCTGIVYQDGTVEIRGASPLREEIQQWQNVCSLVGGAQHVAALTNDGKVLQAGKPDETVSQWEGVKVLSAVNNDTVALHKNGRVSYDGYDAEKRMAVSQWHDITDIAADSQYIVGLGKDKTIRLAGFCPSMFLDLGRKDAAEWSNVELVAAGNSTIAAVTSDGHLKIAGNIFNVEGIEFRFKAEIDRMLKEL